MTPLPSTITCIATLVRLVPDECTHAHHSRIAMSSVPPFIAPQRSDDPAAAAAQAKAIFEASVAHLRDALQRFVSGENLTQHVRACYSFVRVHTETVARA